MLPQRISCGRLVVALLAAAPLIAVAPASAEQVRPYGLATRGLPSITDAQFGGSVTGAGEAAGVLELSLSRAIELGLANNLGLLLSKDAIGTARGQRWLELSRLLPNLSTSASVHHLKESLAITGITLPSVPPVVGPFTYYDARVSLSQRIFDLEAINRTRAAGHEVAAAEFNERDAREVVIVAAGAAYLQALAGYARVETVKAQLATANTILDRAVELHKAGVTPGIDELRARVESLTRSQQLIVAENDLAKQKLTLLRLVGLPVGQEIVLTEKAPFEPLSTEPVDDLISRALKNRDDFRAEQSLLKAAEASHQAARAQRLPSLVLDADYGVTGLALSSLYETFHIVGSVRIPIFEGGRIHGEVLQAEAQVRERREEVDDLRGRIEFQIRSALLDVNAAAREVKVATENVELAELALSQAQERFAAGIEDNLAVVQAQQSVAAAHEALVSSLYRHNLAKLLLARAIGTAGTSGIGGT